jgi:hypothetical protein
MKTEKSFVFPTITSSILPWDTLFTKLQSISWKNEEDATYSWSVFRQALIAEVNIIIFYYFRIDFEYFFKLYP